MCLLLANRRTKPSDAAQFRFRDSAGAALGDGEGAS